jgi:hypothetical protein
MLAVAATDPATTLTRFDAALPFLVAAGIVVIAAIFEDFVTDKVSDELKAWAEETDEDLNSLGDPFQPDAMGKMSVWTVDTAQVVPTVLTPLVGVALLWKQGAKSSLVLAILGIVGVAVIAYWCFLKTKPWKYGAGWPWIFKPLTVLALVLNLAGGAIAYAIGP